MNRCRACHSTQVTVNNSLAQCGYCYHSWLQKALDPFDLDMDDLFGNVDDLVSPKNKKANQKRTREIKKPRLDINTSLITRKPDKDGFSDMDDSDTEERHRKTPACSDSESVVTEDIQSPAVIIKVASDDFQEKDLENEYYVLNPEDDEASLYNSEYTEESDDNDSGPLVFESKMNAKEQKELKKTEKKYKSRPANRFNPFILFNKDMRAKIKEENPELDNYQLSKLIGKEWRNISPVKKEAYNRMSEMKKEVFRNRSFQFAEKPKPPPNVWIFYSKEEVPKVRAEFPHMNVNEASKIAGQRWKALSNEEKQHYKDMVQKAKEEFEKEYPNAANEFYNKSTKKTQRARKNNKDGNRNKNPN